MKQKIEALERQVHATSMECDRLEREMTIKRRVQRLRLKLRDNPKSNVVDSSGAEKAMLF